MVAIVNRMPDQRDTRLGGYVENVGAPRDARSLYRYGQRGIMTRYLVAPRPDGWINCGWTIGDTVLLAVVMPIVAGFAQLAWSAFGPIVSSVIGRLA